MALRAFYILLAVAAVFAAVQVGRILLAQHQIGSTPPAYAIGPENADLEVVEFIDYSCPFCQQIHPTIMEAVKRDGRVRYLPKPLPTQNKRAMNAAIVAYTAGRQGKFIEMHDALISDFANMNDDKVMQISEQIGLDKERYAVDVKDPSVYDQLNENAALYEQLKTGVTPTFLIGRKTVYVPKGTMPTVEDFLHMFEEARR